MEYLRKSEFGQWSLCKAKPSNAAALVHQVLDNPQDTGAHRVLADHYLEQGRHPGKLLGDSRVKDEGIENMHPDLKHLHDWEGLHPAVRPLLNHSDTSSAEERQKRLHHLSDYLIREHTPAMLDMHPELKPHADALRKLPPLRTTEDFKRAHATIKAARHAAEEASNGTREHFHQQLNGEVQNAYGAGEAENVPWGEIMDRRNQRFNHMKKHVDKAAKESGVDALDEHIQGAWEHGHSPNHDAPVHENYFSDQAAEPVREAVTHAASATHNALDHAVQAHMLQDDSEPTHVHAIADKLKHKTNKTLTNALTGAYSPKV